MSFPACAIVRTSELAKINSAGVSTGKDALDASADKGWMSMEFGAHLNASDTAMNDEVLLVWFLEFIKVQGNCLSMFMRQILFLV